MIKDSKEIKSGSIRTFEKTFSICTMVSDEQEYRRMCETAKSRGFVEDNCEFLHVNNTAGNSMDAYESINAFLKQANSRYVIVCHQDIEFKFDGMPKLQQLLQQLEEQDPLWAIAGNAGIAENLKPHLHISEPQGEVIQLATDDAKMQSKEVIALDENFLVFNNRYNLSASRQMRGFHLYGLDVCQNARHLGYKCYAIDFHLLHKSSGNKNATFFENKRQMRALLHKRKKNQLIKTTSTQFYSSANALQEALLNTKPLIKQQIRSRQKRPAA